VVVHRHRRSMPPHRFVTGLMTTVPENLDPFHSGPSAGRQSRDPLQRDRHAPNPRGRPEPAGGRSVRAPSSYGKAWRALRRNLTSFHEEEVPRAGSRLLQCFERTRLDRRASVHVAPREAADRPGRRLERPGLRPARERPASSEGLRPVARRRTRAGRRHNLATASSQPLAPQTRPPSRGPGRDPPRRVSNLDSLKLVSDPAGRFRGWHARSHWMSRPPRHPRDLRILHPAGNVNVRPASGSLRRVAR